MKKTIVVVEDFNTSRKLVVNLLERLGYHVLSAENGLEALKYFEANEEIHLLLTDYNMPVLDGGELIKKVRALPAYRHIPIFVLSTDTSKEKHQKAQESNITAWIAKPYDVEVLVKYIGKALR